MVRKWSVKRLEAGERSKSQGEGAHAKKLMFGKVTHGPKVVQLHGRTSQELTVTS